MIAVCFTKQGVFPGLLGPSKQVRTFQCHGIPRLVLLLAETSTPGILGRVLRFWWYSSTKNSSFGFVLELSIASLHARIRSSVRVLFLSSCRDYEMGIFGRGQRKCRLLRRNAGFV